MTATEIIEFLRGSAAVAKAAASNLDSNNEPDCCAHAVAFALENLLEQITSDSVTDSIIPNA